MMQATDFGNRQDPRRYLPPYGEAFVDTLVRYTKRSFPGHTLGVTRGVTPPAETAGQRR